MKIKEEKQKKCHWPSSYACTHVARNYFICSHCSKQNIYGRVGDAKFWRGKGDIAAYLAGDTCVRVLYIWRGGRVMVGYVCSYLALPIFPRDFPLPFSLLLSLLLPFIVFSLPNFFNRSSGVSHFAEGSTCSEQSIPTTLRSRRFVYLARAQRR